MDFGLSFTTEAFMILLKVIAIDLILSGDNAVVIAMATKKLPKDLRNKAIYLGTGLAIILRILFAVAIAYIINIPLVHFFGGLLLLYIAYKVLVDHGDGEENIKAKDSFIGAVGTIVAADAIMSLDNVIAVAGAAEGHILLLALGVLISIPIMIFGSKIIIKFMEKYPWIAYIGSGILAWTAGEMIVGDKKIMGWLHYEEGTYTVMATIIITALLLLIGYLKNKKEDAVQ